MSASFPALRDARVVVTGGSGFIGTNLMAALLRVGADPVNCDAAAPRDPSQQARWRRCDILEARSLESAVEEARPDFLVHLAARTDMLASDRPDQYRANTEGVANVIAALRGLSTRLAIFTSSKFVFANGQVPRHEFDYSPPNGYGASKAKGERMLVQAPPACPWAIVRPTSIWGPWFDVPYLGFFSAVARGRLLQPRGRRILRSKR
jgi:nucleoside-diphosphate-sugar epimerase